MMNSPAGAAPGVSSGWFLSIPSLGASYALSRRAPLLSCSRVAPRVALAVSLSRRVPPVVLSPIPGFISRSRCFALSLPGNASIVLLGPKPNPSGCTPLGLALSPAGPRISSGGMFLQSIRSSPVEVNLSLDHSSSSFGTLLRRRDKGPHTAGPIL